MEGEKGVSTSDLENLVCDQTVERLLGMVERLSYRALDRELVLSRSTLAHLCPYNPSSHPASSLNIRIMATRRTRHNLGPKPHVHSTTARRI